MFCPDRSASSLKFKKQPLFLKFRARVHFSSNIRLMTNLFIDLRSVGYLEEFLEDEYNMT
jgi:hypothetical protein